MKPSRQQRIFNGYTIVKSDFGYTVYKDEKQFGTYLTLSAARFNILESSNLTSTASLVNNLQKSPISN
jgi:CDP-diacylglycerol pyrophosphatase